MKGIIEPTRRCAKCGKRNAVYAPGDTCRICRGRTPGATVGANTKPDNDPYERVGWGIVLCRRPGGGYYSGGYRKGHTHG